MDKINSKIKKLIEENALTLATIDEKGNPHCIAVGDIKVVSKNQILIGNNFMIETVKNIKYNNNIALAVWNRNWEKDCVGYELKGRAKYFSSGKWHKLVQRIHKGFPAKGAILVAINKIKKLG